MVQQNCKMLQMQLLEVFYKKGVLKNFPKFAGKHLCWSFFFNKVEFCETFKNTFFIERTRALLLIVVLRWNFF